jgi:protein TonB
MNRKRWVRYVPLLVGVILSLLIGVGVYRLGNMFDKPAQTKKQVQQITMIQPPPPPPPPPEVKPPEPEIQEKIEEPKPEPEPEPEQAEEPPPGEDLGVDAEGTAGADGFGLVGKKGGHGLLGGGGGNAVVWYGQQLHRQVADQLQKSLGDKARGRKYSVIVNIWVGPDGGISRAELGNSAGSGEVDEAIRTALAGLRVKLQAPPGNMPQPVKIRIRS